MSMYLNFEPHSWYMGFAIKKNEEPNERCQFTYGVDNKRCFVHGRIIHPSDEFCEDYLSKWEAFTDDGNTYRIVWLRGFSFLSDLKKEIREYHLLQGNGYAERIARKRLDYLRGEIERGQISLTEIAELESLATYIDDSDVLLLEWAGAPEGERQQ